MAEKRLKAVEDAYLATLKQALEDCAAGRWGLFGQQGLDHHDRYRPAALDDLRRLAEEVAELRSRLGYEPFAVHERFEGLRGRGDAHRPGEPKLARQLLDELAE